MKDVRKERTGWRDELMSLRHRCWGWDCPMVDIDFLASEYDNGKSVAVVEYKNEHAAKMNMSKDGKVVNADGTANKSYMALNDLCNRALIGFYTCRYKSDFSEFIVTAHNEIARMLLDAKRQSVMTEPEYVRFLYKLRGRDCPQSVISGISSNFKMLLDKTADRQSLYNAPVHRGIDHNPADSDFELLELDESILPF